MRYAEGAVWRLALIVILALTFIPLVYMVMTSFKDTHQFYHSFWLPSFPLHFENYVSAVNELKVYLVNSLIVTTLSIAGIVVLASVAGFILARYSFPGRELIYYGIIAMMMVPGVLMLVPSFVWVKQLGLIDTYSVMILPYIAGGQILGIFLLRTFFSQIDNGLFEAAQMDGAGMYRQLWHIGLPLARPVLGVLAITSALNIWNNFLWPLVTTSSERVMVLTVGILRYNLRVNQLGSGTVGLMFAGYAIAAIPLGILFMLCTRAFMQGITTGALKE